MTELVGNVNPGPDKVALVQETTEKPSLSSNEIVPPGIKSGFNTFFNFTSIVLLSGPTSKDIVRRANL
jgi:hypothetical protein